MVGAAKQPVVVSIRSLTRPHAERRTIKVNVRQSPEEVLLSVAVRIGPTLEDDSYVEVKGRLTQDHDNGPRILPLTIDPLGMRLNATRHRTSIAH